MNATFRAQNSRDLAIILTFDLNISCPWHVYIYTTCIYKHVSYTNEYIERERELRANEAMATYRSCTKFSQMIKIRGTPMVQNVQ